MTNRTAGIPALSLCVVLAAIMIAVGESQPETCAECYSSHGKKKSYPIRITPPIQPSPYRYR